MVATCEGTSKGKKCLKCSTPSRSGCSRMSGSAAVLPFRSGIRPSFGCQSELHGGREEEEEARFQTCF